jgi:hypothetical protein
MSERKPRTFTSALAVRTALWLLIALYGPSGSGKTYSALRLATGIQRVVGGKIFVIDTENRRAAHYADEFAFEHVDVQPPFDPDSYIDAIAYCEKQGATVIIIDSMSHEHEFVNAWHEAELDRMAGNDWDKRKKVTFSAWIAPKAARARFRAAFMRIRAHVIFCFRADKKLKIVSRQDPIDLGWMPKAPAAFLYEMTASALLMPNARGVPSWNPSGDGEKEMVKLPKSFEQLFEHFKGKPMNEDIGAEMARWAMGDSAPVAPKKETPKETHARLIAAIDAATTHAELDTIARENESMGIAGKFRPESQRATADTIEAKRSTLSEGA